MADNKRDHSLVFGFYLLLAFFMTWPLVARLGAQQIPAGDWDMWHNYWNLWWWKTALLQGSSPYSTDLLFFPGETRLGLHTHSPANMLWTLPINILFGAAAAMNLAVLAGYVLAGFGAYLLARQYTRNRGAAILAGIVFAYFPQHTDQALEHLNLASYYAMPWFVWALVRTVREGGRRWWAATGVFFALNALFAWHNALLIIPLGIAIAAFETWRGSRPALRVLFDLGRSAAIALVLVGPFLWPLLHDSMSDVGLMQKGFPPKTIHPYVLLLPHPGQPLWGTALTGAHVSLPSHVSVGGLGYLGIVAVALAMSGIFLRGKTPPEESPRTISIPPGSLALWAALFFGYLLLSFGSHLDGETFRSLSQIKLPFYWLRQLPLFGLVRIANRFFVPAMLALAILAAMGTDRCLGRLRSPMRKPFLGAMLLLMLLDYAWLPYPMRDLPQPDWIAELDELPPELAVLDIPGGYRSFGARDMYSQTLHGRPIVTGFVASTPRRVLDRLAQYPALGSTLVRSRGSFDDTSGPDLIDSIRDLDIGLVAVHLDRTPRALRLRRRHLRQTRPDEFHLRRFYPASRGLPGSELNQIRKHLQAGFGDPIYSAQDVEIYRVR